MADEDEVFALGGQSGDEMLPECEVEAPEGDRHLLFALLPFYLLDHVIGEFGGAVDDDGFDFGGFDGDGEARDEALIAEGGVDLHAVLVLTVDDVVAHWEGAVGFPEVAQRSGEVQVTVCDVRFWEVAGEGGLARAGGTL